MKFRLKYIGDGNPRFVTAQEVQLIVGASGKAPTIVLLSGGELRLRTWADGAHRHFCLGTIDYEIVFEADRKMSDYIDYSKVASDFCERKKQEDLINQPYLIVEARHASKHRWAEVTAEDVANMFGCANARASKLDLDSNGDLCLYVVLPHGDARKVQLSPVDFRIRESAKPPMSQKERDFQEYADTLRNGMRKVYAKQLEAIKANSATQTLVIGTTWSEIDPYGQVIEGQEPETKEEGGIIMKGLYGVKVAFAKNSEGFFNGGEQSYDYKCAISRDKLEVGMNVVVEVYSYFAVAKVLAISEKVSKNATKFVVQVIDGGALTDLKKTIELRDRLTAKLNERLAAQSERDKYAELAKTDKEAATILAELDTLEVSM